MENQTWRESDLRGFGWIVFRKNDPYGKDGSIIIGVLGTQEVPLPFIYIFFVWKNSEKVTFFGLNFFEVFQDPSSRIG
jgi:hypothetical protein